MLFRLYYNPKTNLKKKFDNNFKVLLTQKVLTLTENSEKNALNLCVKILSDLEQL